MHYPRDYRLLWTGGLAADIAVGSYVFSVPLIVLRDSGSAGLAGIIMGLVSIAVVLGIALGGPVADRFNRRTVMVATQFLQAVLFAVLTFLFVVPAQISLFTLTTITCAAALCSSLNDSAENAAITQVVPTPHLKTAHGMFQGRSYAANLTAPALGGILLALSPSAVTVVTAAACATAAALNLMMRSDFTSVRKSDESFFRSFAAGFIHVSKDQQLRHITLLQFFSNVAITGSIFLLVISLEAAGTPTVIIGSLSGALGGAGIIGAMLVPWITRKLTFNAVLISSSVVVAVTISMASVLSGTYAMAIPLALSVLLAPSAGAVVFARIAVHVDSERLGRVLSVQKLSGIGGSAASKPLTGYAFGAFGQWGSTLLVGSALIAVTISFYIRRVTQGGSS